MNRLTSSTQSRSCSFRRSILFLVVLAFAIAPAGRTAEPADPAAIAAHGQELQKQKKYAEAIAEYDKLVKLLPRAAEPLILRGWAKHLAGDDLHGLADLEMALARKPNDLAALNRRALVNYSAKFWSSAAEDYAAIAKLDPKDARARRFLAECLMMDHKPPEALAAAEEAVAIDPADVGNLNMRGSIRQSMGDFSGALADCEAALKLTKDEKMIAALTTARDRLVAKVAANPSPSPRAKAPEPFQSASDAAMKAAAPTDAAAAGGAASAESTPAVAQLNINQLSAGQYNGAVSVVMEGMRLVLAPLSADETVKFEKKWTPMFSHPSAENITYLNKLNPLVQDFLAVRSQTAEAAAVYDKAAEEARLAAAYESADGTRTALTEAGRCLELLKADKDRMGAIVAQIEQLGDPPDAAAVSRKHKAAHEEAIKVAKRVAGLPERKLYVKVDFYRQPEGWVDWFTGVGSENRSVTTGVTVFPAEERYAYVHANDSRIEKTRSLYPDKDLTNTYYTDLLGGVKLSYYGGDLLDLGHAGVEVHLIHAPVAPPDDFSQAGFSNYVISPVRLAGCPGYLLSREGETKIFSELPGWELSRTYILDAGGAAEGYWVVVNATGSCYDPALSDNQPEEEKLWRERLPILRQRVTDRLDAMLKSLDFEMVEQLPLTEADRLQGLDRFASAHPLRDASEEDKLRLTPWRRGHWALRPGGDSAADGQPTAIQSGNTGHTTLDDGATDFLHTWTPPPAALTPGVPFEIELATENTKQKINRSEYEGRVTTSIVSRFAKTVADWSQLGGQYIDTAEAASDPAKGQRRTSTRSKIVIPPEAARANYSATGLTKKITVEFGPSDRGYLSPIARLTYLYDWVWELNLAGDSVIPPSVLPLGLAGAVQVPPPSAEEIAKAAAEAKWKKERIEEIRQELSFLENNLAREQQELAGERDATRRGSYEFRVLGLRSDIQADEDMIKSLETGSDVHTRSPFDEYAGAQFVQQCQTEAREASQMVRAVVAANRMAAMLPPDEAEKARAFIDRQFNPKAVAEHDVKAAREVLQAVQNTVQGHFEGVAAKADSEAAVAQFGMDAASNIKAAADTGMTVASAFGGQPINYLYQAGTGYIEGGPVQALKAAASAWSNKIDYAVTAYDTYQKEGAYNAASAVVWKVVQNHAMEYIAGKFAGPAGSEPSLQRPTLQEQFDAAKFKQEREWGEALVKDFQQAQGDLMKAGASGAAPEAIMKLQAAARDKAAAVASSLHAKNYLKYKADPAVGSAYDTHMRAIHAEADAGLKEGLKQRKWNADEMELIEFRNSSSYGKPNMDRDVGLRERSLWQVDENGLPMKGVRNPEAWTTGPNGRPMPKPQLTKEGKPMTLDEWREEAQVLYNQAYRKASGGRSADIAMEGITTSTHPEAYKDLMWLGQDKTLISQAWAGQAGDVTRYKAMHILNKADPSAAYFTKLQEVARGTAKDMESKLIPLLKTATPISGGGLRAQSPLSAEAIARSQAHWGEVQSVLQSFGRNDLDPITATRRIRELTGGKSIPEVVDSMATLLESLAKNGRR